MLTIVLLSIVAWFFLGYLGIVIGNLAESRVRGNQEYIEKWKDILFFTLLGVAGFVFSLWYTCWVANENYKINRRRKNKPLGPTGAAATLFGIKRAPVELMEEPVQRGYMD